MDSHISEVKMKADAIGRGTVEVDGVDVSDKITGFQVIVEHREPTRVLLYAMSRVELHLDGVVEIVQEGDNFLEWIETIDPDMLADMAIDTHLPTARGFVEALKELWNGR